MSLILDKQAQPLWRHQGLFERLLRRHVPFKEIGWEQYREEFTRFQILKCRFFNVYVHRLYAPEWEPHCHDHPWDFLTILLWRGYLEEVGGVCRRRRPGNVLFRSALFTHRVLTPYGVSWSLIFTSGKKNDWSTKSCGGRHE